MGWREAACCPSGCDSAVGRTHSCQADWRGPLRMREMQKLPTPDRIALARELLEGTGRVVARDVGEKLVPQWRQDACLADGWNACRAAMLKEDGE